jgi:hypothetical protein
VDLTAAPVSGIKELDNRAVKGAMLFKENHSGESVQRILVYKIIV